MKRIIALSLLLCLSLKAGEDLHPTCLPKALSSTSEKVFVLSIDGGGIRGLIPAVILDYIHQETERKLKQRLDQELPIDLKHDQQDGFSLHLAHGFDLMAGTSTGGIIALGLTAPDSSLKYPRHSIQAILNLYQQQGQAIFGQPQSFLNTLFKHKHIAKPLEDILQHYFGDASLKETITPVVIGAYEIRQESAYLFETLQAREKPSDNFLLKDVARSTSAAPTYFGAAHICNQDHQEHLFVDGGIVVNNPALIAYMRARGQFPQIKKIVLLSLGTGKCTDGALTEIQQSGLLGWGPRIATVMMQGMADLNDHTLDQLAQSTPASFSYLRLQPTLSSQRAVIDNVTVDNIQYLLASAKSFIQTVKSRLDPFIDELVCQYLIKGGDPVWSQTIQAHLQQDQQGFKLSLPEEKLTPYKLWTLVQVFKALTAPLKTLDLKETQLKSEGLAYLAPYLSALQELCLEKNPLQSLAGIAACSSLQHLDLTGITLQPSLFASIPLANLALVSLNLCDTQATDQQMDQLIPNLRFVQSLKVEKNNRLTAITGRHILAQLPSLTFLNANHTRLAPGVLDNLALNTSLTSLSLAHNGITDDLLERPATLQALHCHPRLTELNLHYNNLTHALLPEAFQALLGHHLVSLRLSNNNLGNEGVINLSQVLSTNTRLTQLNLSRNGLADPGIKSLITVLKQSSSFKEIDISHHEILTTVVEQDLKTLKRNQPSLTLIR